MFVFYAHGGSDNHGCEAIIRGTCQNLKGKKVLGGRKGVVHKSM